MTVVVYAIHHPFPDRLEEVKAEMAVLGPPKIEVVNCSDYYMALEGSHRLAAAKALGMAPTLVIYEQGDLITVSKYDWYEPNNWSDATYPAGEVAGELFSPLQAVDYVFDEVGEVSP